jgi:hypothetical protein
MKRRSFLKLSGLVMAAGALTSFSKVNAFSKLVKGTTENFSLEAIVKNPDYAAKLLEEFAKSGNLYNGLIKYSEYPIIGEVTGDLVFVSDNRLIDYTKSYDDISVQLREIRSKLSLPANLKNPVRIRLYKNNNDNISKLFVTQKGNIISNINPSIDDSYTYHGKSGKVVIKVNGGITSVTESECKHQICKKMNSIKNAGDYITCIPNELHIFAE